MFSRIDKSDEENIEMAWHRIAVANYYILVAFRAALSASGAELGCAESVRLCF